MTRTRKSKKGNINKMDNGLKELRELELRLKYKAHQAQNCITAAKSADERTAWTHSHNAFSEILMEVRSRIERLEG